MDLLITARHLKLTRPIREYVELKLAKANKHFRGVLRTQVVLSVEKRTHCAEIILHAAHAQLRALARSEDLYAAIDLASDKIDLQLKKHKERLKEHHRGSSPLKRWGAGASILADASLLAPGVVGPAGAGPDKDREAGVRFSVVKKVPIRPMTREEAAAEMDALGYNFWVFMDKDSGQVGVVYRRQDESYGLLRPTRA